jgi:cephalosporin-C deacetylase-like acetyl esterase
MKRLTLTVVVAAVVLGLILVAGGVVRAEVAIHKQDDGGYRVEAPAYTALVGADGYLQSIKAGEVEMLSKNDSFQTASFVAASVPAGQISVLTDGIKVMKMDKIELDEKTRTVTATSPTTVLAYTFRDEDILIKPKTTDGQWRYLLFFPSDSVVRSLDGLTDFSLEMGSPAIRAASQEGMRLVTRQGAVLRGDEKIDGYANYYWWTDDKKKQQAFSVQANPQNPDYTLRPMANPGPADSIQFTIASDNPNFMHPGGKPVTFDIKAINWGKAGQVDVDFEVRDYLTHQAVGKTTTALDLDGVKNEKDPSAQPIKTGVSVKEPGFYRAALVVRQGDKVLRELKFNFIYDFANYHPADTRPADFKEFWAKAIADVRAIPMDAQMTLHPENGNDKAECYAVSIATLEGRRCWFWYFKPKAEGKYPVTFQCPPTGVRIGTEGGAGDGTSCRLMFTVHTLGLTQEEVDKGPQRWKAYHPAGIESPQTSTWRTIYASMVRCMDFLESRPEVDIKRVCVNGSSQGGGLAIVLAGLDERVAGCMPAFPGLSRLDWTMKYKTGYWPFTMETKPKEQTEEQFLKTLSYFDASNFAPDIKCPTVCLIGMLDWVTAAGGTVCSMACLKPGQVQLICDPWGGHGGINPSINQKYWAAQQRFLTGQPLVTGPSK